MTVTDLPTPEQVTHHPARTRKTTSRVDIHPRRIIRTTTRDPDLETQVPLPVTIHSVSTDVVSQCGVRLSLRPRHHTIREPNPKQQTLLVQRTHRDRDQHRGRVLRDRSSQGHNEPGGPHHRQPGQGVRTIDNRETDAGLAQGRALPPHHLGHG